MEVLRVKDLSVLFHQGYGTVLALNKLSFSILPGECLAIVGESGSGKSTTAKAIMGILGNNAQISSGTITFQGKDLLTLEKRKLRLLMGKDISMVFQDPMTVLDPSYTIYHQLQEVFRAHLDRRGDYHDEIIDLLKEMEFPDPERIMHSYPFELSGGMRQRISLAMAWALHPRLIIADEPTSALDVCTQADLIRLFRQMVKKNGTSLIIITHDLGVVAELADRVLVLYNGERMEERLVNDFFRSPQHPYSKGLLKARPHHFNGRFGVIEGNAKTTSIPKNSCIFFNRCIESSDICMKKNPPDVNFPNGVVRCWRLQMSLPERT